MTAARPERFTGHTFTTPAARSSALTSVVLAHVARDAPLDVLDLGCGTGSQIFNLMAALPRARFTGIDVSADSIERAEASRRVRADASRATFIAGDYMAVGAGPFDLVVSDTVLHAIPAPTEALFGKIARELRPGGLLIYTMPAGSRGNVALAHARRLLRVLRSRATDALLLALARAVHGRQWSTAMLRERILYMYLVPARWDGPALHELLRRRHGLELIASEPAARASLAQLTHRLSVFRRAAPPPVPPDQTSSSTVSITRS